MAESLLRITFDPVKRDVTLKERGLDFADAATVFRGVTFDRENNRRDYGETRVITVGRLDGRMVVIVWTLRDEARHVISMRKPMSANGSDTKLGWSDPDDAPELTDEWFDGAIMHEAGQPKRRPGERGPGQRPAKRSVTLRLDPNVIDHFKAGGSGWQTRINEALKKAIGQ